MIRALVLLALVLAVVRVSGCTIEPAHQIEDVQVLRNEAGQIVTRPLDGAHGERRYVALQFVQPGCYRLRLDQSVVRRATPLDCPIAPIPPLTPPP